MTEFDLRFGEYEMACRYGMHNTNTLHNLLTHVRELEADAAKYYELKAACEREDTAREAWETMAGQWRYWGWEDASEARKAAMK